MPTYRIPYKRDGGWFAIYKMPSNPVKQWIAGIKVPDAILTPPITWMGGTACTTNWKELDPRTAQYTYPMPGNSKVKMITMQGAKLHTEVNMNHLAQAFRSPSIETFWIVNTWMEPLCKYADILLPSNTNFERSDIGGYPSTTGHATHRFAVYMQKCIEPMFESWDDLAIYIELGRRLGIDVLEGKTIEQALKAIFDWSSIHEWISYEEFKKKGYVVIPFPKDYWEKYYQPVMSWYWAQPEGSGLVTPSGKVEIFASPIAEWYGENDPEISPIPKWYDPKVLRPNTWGKYPLIGLLDHAKHRYHTMMEDVAWLRELEKVNVGGYEYEPAYMNPVDAASRGIKTGDIVRAYNNVAEILCGAVLTERVIPGTVRISYASFYDPVDPKKPSLDKGGSSNVLASDEPMSKLFTVEQFEHAPIEVEKWRG